MVMAKRSEAAFSQEEIDAMLKEAQAGVSIKQQEVKQSAEVPQQRQAKTDLVEGSGFGYGVIKHSEGKYAVVELSFNLKDNTAKIEGIVETQGNKAVAGMKAEEAIRRNLMGIKKKAKDVVR
jgi:hypothetical protein